MADRPKLTHKPGDCRCVGCSGTKIGIEWAAAFAWRLWHWRGMQWDEQGNPVIQLR